MDDLGDLAWKGFAKPINRSNTPLSQLSAPLSGTNTPQNRTPPSFSPASSASSTPRMAAATPYMPQGMSSFGSTARAPQNTASIGVGGMKPNPAPTGSRPNSTVTGIVSKPDDVFGSLISFGSGTKSNMANMSLEQQRRVQEQQRQQQTTSTITPLPHQVQPQRSFTPPISGQTQKGRDTPPPQALGSTFDAFGFNVVASGKNSGASTPSLQKSQANPINNDFSDLLGSNARTTPHSSSAIGNNLVGGAPNTSVVGQAHHREVSAPPTHITQSQGHGSWDLDFLAGGGTPSTPNNITSGDDPFDLSYLGSQGSNARQEPVVRTGEDDDNPLGLLAKPVSAVPKPQPKPAPVREPAQPEQPVFSGLSAEATSLDFAIAQIVDMGFDDKSAKAALDATGNDVAAAIEMLVQNREAEQQLGRASSPPRPETPSRQNDQRAHRIAKFRDDYEDESSDSDYAITRRRPDLDYEHARTASSGSERGGITQEKILQTASAIGSSVFNNAKSMLAFSKKKLSEAVEKAQSEIDGSSVGRRGREGRAREDEHESRYQDRSDRYRDDSDDEGHHVLNAPDMAPPTRFRDDDPADEDELRRTRIPAKPGIASAPSPSFFQPQQQSTSPNTPSRPATPQAFNQARPTPPREPTPPPAVVATQQQLHSSNTYKDQGNNLFKQGQFAEAEASYTASIKALPAGHLNLLPLYNNRAAARLKTGQYREAIEDCNAVQDMDKKDVKSLLRRATAWEALEKWENARDDYKLAMGVDPTIKAASQGLARANKALQPPEPAPARPAQVAKPQPTPATKSVLSDFESFEAPSKPMSAFVANAVNEAVQKFRDQNIQAENEEAIKLTLKDQTDDLINRWRRGKEDNLRALLSSLDSVLWPELQWKTINLSELITPHQVKIRYMKAVARVHPDKLAQESSVEHKLIANSVFSTLNKAWDAFKTQNGIS